MADEPRVGLGAGARGGSGADPATVFAALAKIIYQGATAGDIYAALCVAATMIVPGCDHASLLVKQRGRYVTGGASSGLARQIDELERRAGDGPCIDAIKDETPQIETDLTGPTQWPQFAARLVAQTPIRGAMGLRLLVDKRKAAALNLFSELPGRFDSQAAGLAAVLASFAGVAINAAAHGEDAASLRQGLLDNREIGKALGMLMMLHGVHDEQAFDLLRRHSQTANIKLADLARSVIESRGDLR